MRQYPFLPVKRSTPVATEAIMPMTRDQLNRELRMHSASWPAVLIVYAVILGTMILTGMAMV
ncbi:hypothetical protein SAMN05421666_1512 [Roseovarius nanhaiticus]|uniref:Uncharacterized protein n=1 Tax=Roseovarius nanhaiticus TaxID=573024 RepID=A0A1N7FZ83_9RHOB|nr:hypothetical protein SAMN05216208_0624 [Roseovarius nanhaiticus]SIS05554.1 hypothetical protein SAMN05421666_1512 [Roseovarius nanhaiticus]